MAERNYEDSWETVVTQIVVHGRPADLEAAAAGWARVLDHLDTVKASLDTDVQDLGETWKGEAYESFRSHVTGISENLQQIFDEAQRMGTVYGTLGEAAKALTKMQESMPIPEVSLPMVAAARESGEPIPPGLFLATLTSQGISTAPFRLGATMTAVNDFYTEYTEVAGKLRTVLSNVFEEQAAQTPPGTTVGAAAVTSDAAVPLQAGGPGSGTPAGTPLPPPAGAPAAQSTPPSGSAASPALGSGAAGFDPSAGAGSSSAPSVGGLDRSAPGTPPSTGVAGAGFDPGAGGADVPGGTGLAGVSGAGPGGAGALGAGGPGGVGPLGAGGLGAGAGGLGGGAGGGLGGGGLGAPGIGALPGGGAAGRPVTPSIGGAGGGIGAGQAGAGRGGRPGIGGTPGTGPAAGGVAGRPGAAGIPGAGGAAGTGFGDEDEHTTWLTEDEDVWGGGPTDIGPGVLR
ncbi:WXG100 family type VII secretion target [Catenuloplanes japonicus]|uniref:WXG100 family type VII secretion target n=1 Tax=Catenuloplanes japonicus TaxID=33876 RepID=UPI00068B79E9|nr:WXG100 family type VII secretion target [Catenuloplanes japonicus]